MDGSRQAEDAGAGGAEDFDEDGDGEVLELRGKAAPDDGCCAGGEGCNGHAKDRPPKDEAERDDVLEIEMEQEKGGQQEESDESWGGVSARIN